MNKEEFCATAWDQIVTRYLETPGLQNLCLEMQGLYDVDNVMALFLWAADDADLSPNRAGIELLLAETQEWRSSVVKGLRYVRSWMKPRVDGVEMDSFREKVKALELEAERLELDRLAVLFASLAKSQESETPGQSARMYLEMLDVDLDRIEAFCTLGIHRDE